MKVILVKQETRFKSKAMSDARFYVSSCQMFVFLIFADTRRSILICYKEQVR